jgi:hypothetical protein
MSNAKPIEKRTGNYFSDHWRGDLSLPLSYWINGSLVTGATTGLVIAVQAQLEKGDYSLQALSAIIVALTTLATAVWLWGAVGIWRSAAKHVTRGGKAFWAGAAQTMVIIGALNTAGQLVKTAPQLAEYGQIAAGSDPIGAKATLAVNGDKLSMTGWIAAGTADDFSRILSEHPELRRLSLQSAGGRIHEAIQIAAAVTNRGLDTIAAGDCSSACTIVFLSGTRRFSEAGSSLGFHSPSAVGMSDNEAQTGNSEMRAAYDKAGLPSPFIDRAMATSSKSVWRPDETELVEAGIVNGFSTERIVANNRTIERDVNTAGAKRLDEVTTLTGAKASGTELTHLYNVSVPADQIDTSAMGKIKMDTQHQLCADKVNRLLIRYGASYSYEYKDLSGNVAGRYTVSRCPNS